MVFTKLPKLVKGVNRFSLAVTVPALLLLCQGRAEAILNYYIFEDGGVLKIATQGSLQLTGLSSSGGSVCSSTPGGAIDPPDAMICSGNELNGSNYNRFTVTGPFTSFTAGSGSLGPATTTTGIKNWLFGDTLNTGLTGFYIFNGYSDGSSINSSATFSSNTLADLSLIGTEGNIGSWTFLNDTNPTNVINVIVGAPPIPPVPGPLPLLGAAGAYGWSRHLRRRISSAGKP